MQELQQMQRWPSAAVTPQALAWDGRNVWMGSRDLRRVYRINPEEWKVEAEIEAPGIPWAAVGTRDGLQFTIGEGPNDDRYVYHCTPDGSFSKLFACPEFTGSYLSCDGEHLYLSQWYKGRILKLDTDGAVLNEIKVGAETSGHVIVDGVI